MQWFPNKNESDFDFEKKYTPNGVMMYCFLHTIYLLVEEN